VKEAREWLKAATSVAVLTGAGISAESGVPTFRGAGGLWGNLKAEDLATPEGFRRDPLLVWQWYESRRRKLAEVAPNPGHLALAELERRKSRFALITQNVDGLHQKAGSVNVIPVHGDIWVSRCTRCSFSERSTEPLTKLPPHCGCGALLRPGVVWFGELLPVEEWQRAEKAAGTAEVFLVVGTSATVYPAAGLAALAMKSAAKVIEVNPEITPVSGEVDCSLRGFAGEVLPQLIA
jgi:NAD-dependent deacetylase